MFNPFLSLLATFVTIAMFHVFHAFDKFVTAISETADDAGNERSRGFLTRAGSMFMVFRGYDPFFVIVWGPGF